MKRNRNFVVYTDRDKFYIIDKLGIYGEEGAVIAEVERPKKNNKKTSALTLVKTLCISLAFVGISYLILNNIPTSRANLATNQETNISTIETFDSNVSSELTADNLVLSIDSDQVETNASVDKVASVATSIVSSNTINVSKEVLYFFAGVISFEQSDYSLEGQYAVGHVIANRCNNQLTDNNILSNVTAKCQFDTVSTNKDYWKDCGVNSDCLQSIDFNGVTYYTKAPSKQSLEVAKNIVSGNSKNPIGTSKYFRSTQYFNQNKDRLFSNAKNVVSIGGNTFFSDY